MRLPERLRRLPLREPLGILAPLVVLQWLFLVAFVLTVRHNGWLFYQGGDETFYYTSAWTIAQGHVPDAAIGWGWSYLLAPVALIFGTNFLTALPVILLIEVLILLPLGLLAVYGIAARLGGRLLGYVAATLWIVLPYAVIPLWDHRYHEKYVEQFLPQALGLTGVGDFASMIALLCAAYFVVRALDERTLPDAALAGVIAGFAIGIKPSNALFLAGVALAFAAAARWREALVFGAGMAPALIALVLWKDKGLGTLPLFHSGAAGAASLELVPAVSVHLSHYLPVHWRPISQNLDGLREFFWSVRVVEWLVLAGFVGALRRSPAKALLLGGWFGAFFVVKAGSGRGSIEDGSLLRLMLPGFPALLLLVCSIALLVPTWGPRLWQRFPVRARPLEWRGRPFLASAVVLGVLPALLFAILSPLKDASAAKFFENNTYVPVVNGELHLRAQTAADGVHLRWDAPPARARIFYRVFRSFSVDGSNLAYGQKPRVDGLDCLPHTRGAADCSVQMQTVQVTEGRAVLDPAQLKPGSYTYRIGVMANWLDDPTRGDVLLVSRPVRVQVR